MVGGNSPWGKPKRGDGKGDGDGDRSADGTGGGPDDETPPARGPRNPWLPDGERRDEPRRSNIEDLFRVKGPEGPRRNIGGNGPSGPNFRLPPRSNGKSWFPIAIAAIAGLWLAVTSFHQVAPREQAIVTWFGGKYASTLNPGLNLTFPWPIQQVEEEPVTTVRSEAVPGSSAEKLILTGDQNLVDLSYLVRWNIKDLKQYRFQLAEPEETVREVAEAAMRASVAEHELDRVLSGGGRADIEQSVRQRMQALLDTYRAGIRILGVDIQKTDPPARVVDAFKDVSAAQQDAETDINRSRAYAQQILARAQGDAASFDKIYEEYRLAPEVTRRRLYYETMERVLSQTDKTVVEAEGVTPYLPLPEVRRRSQPTDQAAAAPAEGTQ